MTKNNDSAISSGVSKSLQQDISIKLNENLEKEKFLTPGESFSPVSNPFTVTENGIDVTASATITTTVKDKDGNVLSAPFTAGESGNEYTILYYVKYDSESTDFTTTIYVK